MPFNDRWVQSDLAAELQAQILRAVERRVNLIDARRGVSLQPAIGAPTNPLAASREGSVEGSFATGYDSVLGVTVVPFQWGLSTWDGGDQWTGVDTVDLFTWNTSRWNDGSGWGPAT